MAWNLRQFRKRRDFPIETRELRNTLMFFCEVDGSRGRGKETSSEKSLNVWSFVGCLSWVLSWIFMFETYKSLQIDQDYEKLAIFGTARQPFVFGRSRFGAIKMIKGYHKTLGKHISVEGKVTITSTQQSTYRKLSKSLLYQACGMLVMAI